MQNKPIQCTYALSVEDTCKCDDCVRRREMNAQPRSQSGSMAEQIRSQAKHHEDQFDIASEAAISRGFQRWFDDTWLSARANGAMPNAFISSMFVFFTTVLTKKFMYGLHPDMPIEHKEMALADAKRMMAGYLDQIEAAAIKELHNPHPPESESTIAPVTPKGKQTIILPKKKVLRH